MGDRDVAPLPKRSRTSGSEVGLSDRSYSSQRRRMLDLVNQLHSAGLQSDIDLPQVAVIGSQSAGKSSLIESISGITLPRASGTCTRCPMECRLSSSGEKWQCVISLRFETEKTGASAKKVREIPFGPVIYAKEDVEDRLRRAQLAILNPDIEDKEQFLTGSPGTLPASLSFSSNSVCLQISGPDVADLSFVDLPGVIATVRDGNDSSDIDKVKNLVTNYISRPSTVILLTVSCENDYENQGASQLANENNPDGSRMIGVLTKPDRIEKGEENRWLGFVRNTDQHLRHGWFCVKQPSPAELKEKVTWEEARKREREFFATRDPWASLDHLYTRQLGTKQLMQSISGILSALISSRLPDLVEETEQLLIETEARLRELPKAISTDPVQQMWKLVIDFDRDLQTEVAGTSRENGLIQLIRKSNQGFREAVYRHAPRFYPISRAAGGFKALTLPKADFLQAEDGDTALIGTATGDVLYIDEIMARAERAISRELPDNYPYVVKRDLIAEFVAKWEQPAMMLFTNVESMLREFVQTLVVKHFGSYAHGGLVEAVQSIIREELAARHNEAIEAIHRLLKYESTPFTSNEHYLADYKDKYMSYYRDIRSSAAKALPIVANAPTVSANGSSPHTTENPPFLIGNGQPSAFGQTPSFGGFGQPATTAATLFGAPFGAQPSSLSLGAPPPAKFYPIKPHRSTTAAGQPASSTATGQTVSSTAAEKPTSTAVTVTQPIATPSATPSAALPTPAKPVAAPAVTPSRDRDERVTNALAALAAAGYTGLAASDLARLLPPDPTDPAIEIMAEVRAYYQVAFKRFADNVPLAIDWDYVRAFAARARDALVTRLALSAPDARERCCELLEETPDVALLRGELEARRERLSTAMNALRDMRVRAVA